MHLDKINIIKYIKGIYMLKILLSLSLFAGCVSTVCAAEMAVVSKKPLSGGNQEVRQVAASFSHPVVSLTSLSKAGENCPLKVYEKNSPEPLKGRCRWQGTQTVVFEPESPFRVSSEYRAVISGGIKSADGSAVLSKKTEWTFTTPLQTMLESAPENGQRWVGEKSDIYLAFRYPVNPEDTSRYVHIEETGTGNRIPFTTRRAEVKEVDTLWKYYDNISTATVAVLTPSGLQKGKKYRISVEKGFPSAGSTLGMSGTRVIDFETVFPLKIMKTPVTECLPYNPEIQFSNPVRYDEFIKNITISPAIKLEVASSGQFEASYDGATWLGGDHAFLRIPGSVLKPAVKYTVTVSPELKDIFGQKLGEKKVFSFRTGDICPSVQADGGFGVLESYYPRRHPVEAVNAGEIKMQKLVLNRDNFIPFYLKGHNTLPEAAFASVWKPADGLKNTKIYTYIDFDAVQEYENAGFFYAKLNINTKDGSYPVTIWDNATDLGVTIKSAPDSVLLWVTRLKTGKTASGVRLQLRDNDNRVLWSGVTDKNGLAVAPGYSGLGMKNWKRWERPELWVFAESPKGTAVLNSTWNSGIEPWRFNIDYEYNPKKETYSASVFTDRGIYRSGETVNLKGIIRKIAGGDWKKTGLKQLRLSVFDSRGGRIFSGLVPLSENSSFSRSIKIPAGSPSGIWKYAVDDENISAEEATSRIENPWGSDNVRVHFEGDFKVEDFKPAVFDIKARALRNEVYLGDKFEGMADGRYMSGASLSGAKTTWSLRLEQTSFEPAGWKGYSFDTDMYEPFTADVIASGSGTLGSKGTVKNSVKLPKTYKGLKPLRAVYEAGITSPDGQNLFARGYATVHRSDLYIGVKQPGTYSKAGEPRRISFIAVHPDGKIFRGTEIKVEAVRRQWVGSRRAGLGGRLEWVNEKKDTVLDTVNIKTSDEPSSYEFTPREGGSYFFRFSGKDAKNRPCEITSEFYVQGGGDAWWNREDNDILEVTAEKDNYKVGETAKIFVKSPWKDVNALVTVEREGVLEHFIQKINDGASVIEIPVKDSFIPNAYVSVVLVQGRTAEPLCKDSECSDLGKPQGRFGYAHFTVKPENRGIDITVKTDKEEYRPGDTVKVTVQTKDEKGQPVPAEVTLSAVDEGVLALTEWKVPDIFGSFYGSRPLSVTTADTRLHIIGQRSYGEKGERRGGGGGLSLAGIDLRSNFKASAYWNPSVNTGVNGEAVVTFKLPDNLTRFLLSGVAASTRRFGSGETVFTVNKPLMLSPVLPSFARTGDRFSCGVMLQNYSHSSQSGTLNSAVTGAVSASVLPGKFSAGSGSSKVFLADCTADKTGKGVFAYSANAGTEKDGLRREIKVRDTREWEYNYVSGVIDSSAEVRQTVEIPYENAAGQVEIEVSNSIVTGLKGGEDYILSYPYEMLESQLARAQLLQSSGKSKEAAAVINSLSDYQTAGGGLSYWKGGRLADPYITAEFLRVAYSMRKNTEYKMSQVADKAKTWLSSWVKGDNGSTAYIYSEKEKLAAKAQAVYALALHGVSVKDRISSLYASRNSLSVEGQAWLLRAMKASGYDQAATGKLAENIMAVSRTTASTMFFEEKEILPWLHSSSVNTTASVLSAMLEVKGGFNGDSKVAEWLLRERKTRNHWRTLPENLAVWQALKAYAGKYEKTFSAQKTVVTAGGKNAISATLDSKKKKANAVVFFNDIFVKSPKNPVNIRKEGSGRVYYGYRMKFQALPRTEAVSEGLEISRTVKPLSGRTLKAGDRALVTIKVKTPQDRMFVAVNDPVPAGFEIVSPGTPNAGGEGLDETGGMCSGFTHSEKYEDRMVLTADYLPAGEHSYTYLVQAVTAGEYTVPAAKAECIYEPEIFGATAVSREIIKP